MNIWQKSNRYSKKIDEINAGIVQIYKYIEEKLDLTNKQIEDKIKKRKN